MSDFKVFGLAVLAIVVVLGSIVALAVRSENRTHEVAFQGASSRYIRERGFYAAIALQGIIDRDPIVQSSEERILQVREALQYSDILLQLARTEDKP